MNVLNTKFKIPVPVITSLLEKKICSNQIAVVMGFVIISNGGIDKDDCS